MRATLLIVMLSTALLCGCETLEDDLDYLGESLMPPTPTEAAEMMFDEYDPENRRKGMTLIANSPFGAAEPYVEAYQMRVEEERNPIVKAVAIRALARHGEVEHASLIADQLQDPAQQVRWEAAKGLQRIHDPGVVTRILDALRNEEDDRDVKAALVTALGQYPEDRVFQILIGPDALDASELAVNLAAQKSLRTLTGIDHGGNPAAWLRWYNATAEPFAGQQPYYYPTYERDKALLEYIAFWTEKHWETPRQPVGLRADETRSTYEADGATDDGEG